ncbi:MAG: acyltransferase domain-containing protein [Gammaproteobacteria bacterium]|nr:acyltransferase domain-containing protein [Gammaproteobacteria bacterium]
MPESVAINGFSCRFPMSSSPEEFWKNLITHQDMISEQSDRWPAGQYGIPPRFGVVKDIDQFDAQFFDIHGKQAQCMDPQLRLLLEVSHEAFVDSGINPFTLSNNNVGVFVGACFPDAMANSNSNPHMMRGYENTGTALSMLANRLSYFYDLTGPSKTIDTACSSGLVALDEATRAIQSGQCDMAVVASANIILRPGTSVGFTQLNMLAADGKCKAFDESANGYVRSEGVVVLVLTAKSKSSRIRAEVLGTATNNDGYTSQGITFPNSIAQEQLLRQVYETAGVGAAEVDYIEAHGTGTQAGDPAELDAIDRALAQQRSDTLKVGSVKTNMGHSESTAGLAGVCKVLLAMEHGTLPANLHYSKPNPNIESLRNGNIQVVSENEPWKGGIVGINSFGFGGTNAHAIIRGGFELAAPQQQTAEDCIVPLSHRTEDGLSAHVEQLSNTNLSNDHVIHLQGIANIPSRKNPYRACLLPCQSDDSAPSVIKADKIKSREVWWIFSGMGAQWEGMGTELLKNPLTSSALNECAEIVKPLGVDLVDLLTAEHGLFDHSPKACFIAISAMQVAMVDLLRSLDVPVDRLLGHSLGEIACAYADGALTKRQTMEVAFWRGQCLEDTPETRGKMAAVELTWEQAHALEGEELFAACHNGENNVTISGTEAAIDAAVDKLIQQGVESKVVGSAGIAFHTAQLDSVLPAFEAALDKVVGKPKSFSSRWISTCLSADDLQNQVKCDVNYLSANLRNPVRFNDAINQIPDEAIVIEVGPTTLFYSTILLQNPRVKYTGLSRRDVKNNTELNGGIARLFSFGVDINWHRLNPTSGNLYFSNTPSKVSWLHKKHDVPLFDRYQANAEGGRTFDISLAKEEYQFIQDHQIAGKVLFPGVGYLYLVWQLFAENNNTTVDQQPIQFSNIKFLRATRVHIEKEVQLTARYSPASGLFELAEGEHLVVTGSVSGELNISALDDVIALSTDVDDNDYLDKSAAYTKTRLRGYQYGPEFQGIERVSCDGMRATLEWRGNWVSLLDAMLQVNLFGEFAGLTVPTAIRSVRIDPEKLAKQLKVDVYKDRYDQSVMSKAVEIEGLESTPINDQWWRAVQPNMASHEFVPYFEDNTITNAPVEDQRYAKLAKSYVACGALKVIEKYEHENETLPLHLSKTRKVLENLYDEVPDQSEVDYFIKKEHAAVLRVAVSIFADDSSFISEPLQSLFAHEEFASIYSHDYYGAHLFRAGYVEEMCSIIYENYPVNKALTILEAGAGTGGLTSIVLPTLSDTDTRYLATDISAGFFGKLKERFSDYQSVFDCATWDINEKLPEQLVESVDVVVASNALHVASNLTTSLKQIYSRLEDGGFLLLHECVFPEAIGMFGFLEDFWNFEDEDIRTYGPYVDSDGWKRLLKAVGFKLVSVKNDGVSCALFLCRKVTDQKESVSVDIHDRQWSGFEQIQSELSRDSHSDVWLRGTQEDSPGLLGLGNCIRYEPGGERIKLLYMNEGTALQPDLAKDIFAARLYQNIVRGGKWGSFRYLPYPDKPMVQTDTATLAIETVGDLSSIAWEQAQNFRSEIDDIRVAYGALNFKDVMVATGRVSHTAYGKDSLSVKLINEFSGLTRDGSRVMGLILDKPVCTRLSQKDLPKHGIWEIPQTWTLAEAATVPIAYSTAYCALLTRATITAGQSVLIHSALSGVGQACIRIAMAIGCEVFVTVGSDKKRNEIRKMFPAIPASHIGHSRDKRFERWLMHETEGEGVDVIVNCLAGELLQSSLRLISRYGKFIEIGRYDMAQNTPLGMGVFLRDAAVLGVGMNNVARNDSAEMATVWALMQQGITDGTVVPLQPIVFSHDQIEEAFRFSAKGEHFGKVMLAVNDHADEMQFDDLAWSVTANSCFWANPDKSYIVTGGLGGLGLELSKWLVSRGAQTLIITSRSGVKTPYQEDCIHEMEKSGANIIVSQRNVAHHDDCQLLLSEAENEAPVAGVFHLAMVLEDALFQNQTEEKFENVLGPKLNGGRHLDDLSRVCCPELEHFVVFSSLSGGYGNLGQTNYGYANIGLDRLCDQRKAHGYPALSVQWGIIGDVGFAHENADSAGLVSVNSVAQGIASCMNTLETFLTNSQHTVVSSYVHKPVDFREISTQQNLTTEKDFQSLLKDVSNVMGLESVAKDQYETPFEEFGLDSLMSVEIISMLDNQYKITMDLATVRKSSFRQLQQMFEGVPEEPTTDQSAIDMIEDTASVVDSKFVAPGIIVNEKLPIIEEINLLADNTEVIYFLAGAIIDPVKYLNIQSISNNKMICAVRYERANSATELFEEMTRHMKEVSNRVQSIKVLGYSTGAILMHRFLNTLDASQLSCTLESVSVSPPHETVYKELEDIGSDALSAMDEEELYERLENSQFWTELSRLSYPELQQQFLMLLNSDITQQEYGVSDLIVLPENDPYCWPYEKSTGLARQVITIEADHESALTSLSTYF